MLQNYEFEALDRSAKIPKKPRLSDSGCTKSVFAKDELDKYRFKYGPNVHRERLMAAGNSEMRVCGVLDSLYTYNGKTKIMHGLVTPDLSGEIIVSRFDAERVGAIKIDRSDAKVSILTNAPKRKSETMPDITPKRVKFKNDTKKVQQVQEHPVDRPGTKKAPPVQVKPVDQPKAKKALNAKPVVQEKPLDRQIAPKVPKPVPKANQSDSDQYKLILSPFSKTKIDKKIKEWNDKYQCLSDKLSPKPMVGPAMKINLKSDMAGAPKKAMTAVIIPLHYKEASNELIRTLLRDKVIRKVKESSHSRFQSRAFVVPKPGGPEAGVRLVIDFSEANKWIERPTHPFAAGNDLLKSIPPEAQWFCKLDALWGYYQIPLDEDSMDITRFIHELGIFEYLRAPMGLNASGDEFCRRSDDAVAGLPGVIKLIDDILIYASTLDELFERTENVLKVCSERNITLSCKKMQIGKRTTFAGFDVSCLGVKPTQDRLEAVKIFQVPTTLTMLRGFLGLANQLAHFIPDGAQISEPLRELTKVKTVFHWGADQSMAFEAIKNALDHNLILHFFDPKLQTILVTDASRIGLGFLLYQDAAHKGAPRYRLIQCGSRSVSGAESRYAVCELECLAILWAIKKCKYYLAGIPTFKVHTDHNSLVGLFKKELPDVQNPRLLKYLEDLQGYNFETKYVPGKDNLAADMLSRHPVWPAEPESDADKQLCHAINTLVDNRDPLLEPLLKAAAEDEEYQSLIKAIQEDVEIDVYPSHHPIWELKSYWHVLSLHQLGLIIVNNDRIIVPRAYRPKLLEIMHIAHCGEQPTQWLARKTYFWIGMSKEIEKYVKKCKVCLKKLPSQVQQPIVQRNKATYPWQVVGSDLFELNSRHYIVVVDQFSGFPLVAEFPKAPSALSVINQLEHWFCIFGVPQEMISDNGPQYRAAEMAQYALQRGFKRVTSDPHYPQANGLAESAVKNVKKLLEKHGGNYKKFNQALMLWRNFPNKSGASPAQMFLGHEQRTMLPMLPGQYDFQIEKSIKSANKRKHIRSEEYEKRKGKPLSPLHIGQKVAIQTQTGWDLYAKVKEVLQEGRSYNLITDQGAQLRRNRVMLRPLYEVTSDESSDEEETDSIHENSETNNPDVHVPPSAATETRDDVHVPLSPVSETRGAVNQTRKSSRAPAPRKPCACCKQLVCKHHGTETY